MNYHRIYIPGGTYFFTLVTHQRRSIFSNDTTVDLLRECFRRTMQLHPFSMPACVILPDHIHAIWTLPAGDPNYSTRWQLIKSAFTRRFSGKESYEVSPSRAVKGEQAVWQRRGNGLIPVFIRL